jgi:hypothetical protein
MKYLELAKQMLESNYHAVGVRSLSPDENYEIWDNCRDSYSWDFEADTSSFETDGQSAGATCATNIDIQYYKTDDWINELSERIERVIEKNKIYGSKQVIIAGESGIKHDDLFDPDEVRIVKAFVIDVI